MTQMGARGGAVGADAVLAYIKEKGGDPAPFAAVLAAGARP